MELFWKGAALVLLTMILAMVLAQQEKGMASLVALAGCCMACTAAVTYIRPVLEFLQDAAALSQLPSGAVETMLSCMGVALAGEVIGALCRDAGFGSLAQSLQLLSSAGILYLSVPVLRSVLELIGELLNNL